MIYKCPHCHDEINNLNFSSAVSEFGTAYFSANSHNGCEIDEHETENSETNETTYTCPECSDEIDPFTIEVVDEEDEKPKTKPSTDDAESHIEIINPSLIDKFDNNFTDASTVCRKCRKIFIARITIQEDWTPPLTLSFRSPRHSNRNSRDYWKKAPIACPQCGTLNDPSRYISRLQKRMKLAHPLAHPLT